MPFNRFDEPYAEKYSKLYLVIFKYNLLLNNITIYLKYPKYVFYEMDFTFNFHYGKLSNSIERNSLYALQIFLPQTL